MNAGDDAERPAHDWDDEDEADRRMARAVGLLAAATLLAGEHAHPTAVVQNADRFARYVLTGKLD